jgi:hypothetical protein
MNNIKTSELRKYLKRVYMDGVNRGANYHSVSEHILNRNGLYKE